MYVVDSATVSIHIVCLCLVLPMFRLVGFIFATAKAPQQSSLHPTDGRDGGRLGGPSLGGSLCNHFELWRQDSWSNASFYGWRESIWATGIFSLMVGLPPARRAVIYWSEWSWSCSPANLSCPAPPTFHLAHSDHSHHPFLSLSYKCSAKRISRNPSTPRKAVGVVRKPPSKSARPRRMSASPSVGRCRARRRPPPPRVWPLRPCWPLVASLPAATAWIRVPPPQLPWAWPAPTSWRTSPRWSPV